MCRIIADDHLHCLWLNTLSMLENAGARKIVSPHAKVIKDFNVQTLWHSWFLHLKTFAMLLTCPDFSSPYILAPRSSYFYLNRLDVSISRLIKDKFHWSGYELKQAVYLLVTYAIEVRAELIYSVYEGELRKYGSPVSVRGILVEEKQYLHDIEVLMNDIFLEPKIWMKEVESIENKLFSNWMISVNAFLKSGNYTKLVA